MFGPNAAQLQVLKNRMVKKDLNPNAGSQLQVMENRIMFVEEHLKNTRETVAKAFEKLRCARKQRDTMKNDLSKLRKERQTLKSEKNQYEKYLRKQAQAKPRLERSYVNTYVEFEGAARDPP